MLTAAFAGDGSRVSRRASVSIASARRDGSPRWRSIRAPIAPTCCWNTSRSPWSICARCGFGTGTCGCPHHGGTTRALLTTPAPTIRPTALSAKRPGSARAGLRSQASTPGPTIVASATQASASTSSTPAGGGVPTVRPGTFTFIPGTSQAVALGSGSLIVFGKGKLAYKVLDPHGSATAAGRLLVATRRGRLFRVLDPATGRQVGLAPQKRVLAVGAGYGGERCAHRSRVGWA